VKALRYYDEEGVLKPSRVDAMTGYRFYDEAAIDRARAVRALRDLDFSVDEIARILPTAREDGDIGAELARKAAELNELSRAYGKKAAEIERALELASTRPESEDKATSAVRRLRAPALRAAEVRFRGTYKEVGRCFGALYRALGRHARGPAFCLYRELSYAEDADISACMEIAEAPVDPSSLLAAGINVIEVPEVEGIEIVHLGPYSRLGESYGSLFAYAGEVGRTPQPPIREFYEKGPGLIFRGDEGRYRTRIFLPLD
jgi:DNA-binding transcriptional MerR regulator